MDRRASSLPRNRCRWRSAFRHSSRRGHFPAWSIWDVLAVAGVSRP